MKTVLLLVLLPFSLLAQRPVSSDEMERAARQFLQTLTAEQRAQAQLPFANEERFNWYYFPNKRNGLPLKAMQSAQRQAALTLLRSGLSAGGYGKAEQIMDLENVLRVIENRPPNDTYRDPENYYVTIFGEPGAGAVNATLPWGWRVDGHHLSVHYSSLNGRVVGLTPLFLGSNPGEVRADVPQKGRRLLHEETDRGFALLRSLSADQRNVALITAEAYGDILTRNNRVAKMEKTEGLAFSAMGKPQQKRLLELLQTYLNNYPVTLAKQQLRHWREADLAGLHFAWAGDTTGAVGKGYYYRLHGPTLLIEFDNVQNQANHIHTVVRDLRNDFGEDVLRQHYASEHKK